MTLGLAIVIVMVLYLIDKHRQWKTAFKVLLAGFVLLAILAGIDIWNVKHQQTKRQQVEDAGAQARQDVENARRHAGEQVYEDLGNVFEYMSKHNGQLPAGLPLVTPDGRPCTVDKRGECVPNQQKGSR